MVIRELKYSDVKEYKRYIKEWKFYNEKIVPQASDIKTKNFNDFIEFLNNEKRNSKWVNNTTLFYFEKNEILGSINVRFHLNESLLKVGGHIGYGVKKSRRGNGIAEKLLKKGMETLKLNGYHYALITCSSENIASQKVISKFKNKKISNSIDNEGYIQYRYILHL